MFYDYLHTMKVEKLIESLEKLTTKKVILEGVPTIKTRISNWAEFSKSFNEFNLDAPNKYMNPMEIWHVLNKKVTDEFNKTGLHPEHVEIEYDKVPHADSGMALFAMSGVPGEITYEYTGIAK